MSDQRCANCDYFNCKAYGNDGPLAGKCFLNHAESRRVEWIADAQNHRCEKWTPAVTYDADGRRVA